MKEFLATVYGGGDEAVAAVKRMGKDWRAMLEQAAKEVEAARLTDAERESVRFCAVVLDMGERPDYAATLRGLLERLA